MPKPKPSDKTKNPTALEIMKAHQFFYYVESDPIWSDRQYDLFCERYSLNGNGGSDLRDSYPIQIIYLAERIRKNPHSQFFTHPLK